MIHDSLMIFRDITRDTQTKYVLDQPETHLFFLSNRSGDITFELTTPGAKAHIFALFTGKNDDKYALTLIQHHVAPRTTSHVLVKSVLDDHSSFAYNGTIRIDPAATESDASQTNRNLLLSDDASASSVPILEILTDDVTCRHAATTSRPNPETLWYMMTRGIVLHEAESLYAKGFVDDTLKEVGKLTENQELEIKNQAALLRKLYS